ncbi:Bifunctional inhibitor/plant lipid transfer protein/seed storage helical domain [Macleaya cordata]|uniref:Bifunctional inhibitor/plant lipid transfer protein/seed storage helical domain n=1 Tax=Macleaya cordata TaxID=56857 RepID=A0A200RDA8_MACCD|nr:Bifunctional inhibitor/plant lipid transfer protein/seed storage helical domain [Macleaya cordata]
MGLISSCMFLIIIIVMVMGMLGVRSDMGKEREECTDQLIKLSTCLPYVGGTARAPTPECCTDLKQVLSQSKKCLCILVKDRNDPALGLNINATLALSLPHICKSPADVSKCPVLLHLAPNSPEARVFEQFADRAHGNKTGAPSTGAQEQVSNNNGGSRENRWVGLGVKMIGGVSIWCLTFLFILGV